MITTVKKNLSIINKISLKCICILGSVLNGIRELLGYTFVSDKLPGYKVFCNPERLHYKKNKKNCFEFYYFLLRR